MHKTYTLLTLVLLACILTVCAYEARASERYWSELFCQDQLGTPESYVLGRKRIDCESDDIAWEVDWAKKFYQGIGQALVYGWGAQKSPGLVLLIKEPKDWPYAMLAARYITDKHPDMYFRIIAPHYEWGCP